MNYLALFNESNATHNSESEESASVPKNALHQNAYQTQLNEALSLIASLYPKGFFRTLSPEQEKQVHEIQRKLDEALLLGSKTDYLNAIAEWERAWLLLLGYHPVPQESVSRMQLWDHQKVQDTILRGYPIRIWSVVLGEWIFWVRDSKIAEKIVIKYPGVPIYTLQELKIMTEARWTREYLQKMHLNKSVLGATLIESSRSES